MGGGRLRARIRQSRHAPIIHSTAGAGVVPTSLLVSPLVGGRDKLGALSRHPRALLRHSCAGRNPGDRQRWYAPRCCCGPPEPRPCRRTPRPKQACVHCVDSCLRRNDGRGARERRKGAGIMLGAGKDERIIGAQRRGAVLTL